MPAATPSAAVKRIRALRKANPTMGLRAIAAQLAREGILGADGKPIGKTTVAQYVTGGADRVAAPPRQARPCPGPPADGEHEAPAEGPAEDELPGAGVDLERLPAHLLTLGARQTGAALRDALTRGDVVAADKLAGVLDRFAVRLVAVRPPEKVDPVKDPTNVEARREILDRWEALREPWEVSAPVIEAIEAHVLRLRQRCAAQGSSEAGPDASA